MALIVEAQNGQPLGPMETDVIVERPARTWVGDKQKKIPGPVNS